MELPHPRNFGTGCGCHSGGTEATPVLPWDLQLHTAAPQLDIPEALPAQCSPGSTTVCPCSTWIPCHMEEHPHPVSQVPGLCHRDVPKTVIQDFPRFQPRFLRQRSLCIHTHPCPLGRIPSWIYFCRFACLGMKGICRGRAAIGRGGLEPPGLAFADQRVTFPGNLGDPGGQGLLLDFHVGSFRMVFH